MLTFYNEMSEASCWIFLFGHFSANIFTTLPWGRGKGKLSKKKGEGVVTISRYLRLLLFKTIGVMFLKLPVYVEIVISFHNQIKFY